MRIYEFTNVSGFKKKNQKMKVISDNPNKTVLVNPTNNTKVEIDKKSNPDAFSTDEKGNVTVKPKNDPTANANRNKLKIGQDVDMDTDEEDEDALK